MYAHRWNSLRSVAICMCVDDFALYVKVVAKKDTKDLKCLQANRTKRLQLEHLATSQVYVCHCIIMCLPANTADMRAVSNQGQVHVCSGELHAEMVVSYCKKYNYVSSPASYNRHDIEPGMNICQPSISNTYGKSLLTYSGVSWRAIEITTYKGGSNFGQTGRYKVHNFVCLMVEITMQEHLEKSGAFSLLERLEDSID